MRRAVPPAARAALRRSGLVNRYLSWRYGGERTAAHPRAPYDFTFDGYRNIGWSTGGLADCETTELDYAGRLIRDRGARCVWDVGANVGLWSLYLASLSPPVERVLCFEPDPVNLHYLRLNRDRNRLGERLELRPFAVSRAPGEATFYSDTVTGKTGSLNEASDFIGTHYGAKRTAVTVKLTTVDAEVEAGTPPPEFMKVDVEGHELEVLEGARLTLARHRPAMLLEVTRHTDEVGRLLADAGYVLCDPATGRRMDRPAFATAAFHRDDPAAAANGS